MPVSNSQSMESVKEKRILGKSEENFVIKENNEEKNEEEEEGLDSSHSIRLLTFNNDTDNEIKLCEYEAEDGEKEIILWSKFMEKGIFLDKYWYEKLTVNDKETLVNYRENIFVRFLNNGFE